MEFTSGNDIIPLKTPGKKWYICGAPNHCANGNQKLAITVFGGQSPAPSPTSAARRSVAPVYYGWMVAFFWHPHDGHDLILEFLRVCLVLNVD